MMMNFDTIAADGMRARLADADKALADVPEGDTIPYDIADGVVIEEVPDYAWFEGNCSNCYDGPDVSVATTDEGTACEKCYEKYFDANGSRRRQ